MKQANKEEKKSRKLLVGIALISLILSLGFFYILYCSNNKYMTREEKAVHGILYVEGDYDDLPVYYLSQEWEYYPNVLLTPQDDLQGYSCEYLSIGEAGKKSDHKDDSPYECGTYRLQLLLPEEEHTYGLYLPEVYSAYRLYINGSLMEQVGNPDPSHYKEEIQKRMFTFKGKERSEILIAVTDKSSASLGISQVPAFGQPVKVNTIRGIPIFLDSAVFTFILVIMLLSLWAFLGTGSRTNVLFAGVCICMMGYTCYSLLHTYVAMRVQPWYSLEMLFYYMLFPAMLLLEKELTAGKGRWLRLIAALTGIAGIIITMAGIFAGRQENAGIASGISCVTGGIKWVTALCMLIAALLYSEKQRGMFLLVGTVIYAASLIADQLWPMYDPVVGGLFPEWGGTILAGVFGLILWKELTEGYRMRLLYEEQSRQMELRLLMQKEHYEKLTEVMEETSRTRHDLRQYIRTASMLLEEEHYQELKEYFHRFAKESQENMQTPVCYSKNMSVDAIFHSYGSLLKQEKVRFEHSLEVPENVRISDLDMCRIFGNLLENAVNAVKEDTDNQERYVSCVCKVRKGKLLIEVENTYKGEIRKIGDSFYSGSHSGRGIGTASVCQTAEKYGGYADFVIGEKTFRANVFIPIEDGELSQENR